MKKKRAALYALVITGFFWIVTVRSACALQDSTTTTPRVLLMHIQSDIDPRMSRYVELALKKAEEETVDHIIIEMDTYGGAVNDADYIRTRILEAPKPVYVFINKDAASAGALISIACDSIYMAPGASIGAATVVTQTGEAAPDKYQSYMRSIMRSTAEATGRDPRIAEAMVDESIAIDSVTTAGNVITFSTSEAIKYGFCEGMATSVADALHQAGLEDYELITYQLSRTEKIISIFLNPFISGILILIIIGGIYFELQTPGVGFPILASFVAALLYFTPYYLNGLAENWEILAFVAGVVLIVLEIFVIPGFGIAGISGIVLTLGSLILVMLNNDMFDFSFVAAEKIIQAAITAIAGLLGGIVLMFFGGIKLADSKAFKRIALQDTFEKKSGYTSNFRTESMLGKKGVTYSVLRPSGKVMIEDQLHDAYTRGGYIEAGVEVIVIDEEGTTLKVKEV